MAWGTKGGGRGSWGKHFVGGFEIQITVVTSAGVFQYHNTRIYGWAVNGVYKVEEEGSDSVGATDGYGANITTNIPGLGVIETVWDFHNNIAEVQADFCGVAAGIRLPDKVVKKNMPRMFPGVYVKVNEKHDPEYVAKGSSLCFAPKDQNHTVEVFQKKWRKEFRKNIPEHVVAMYFLLKSTVGQNFPNAPRILTLLTETARECDDKKLLCALKKCTFIGAVPKFLRCWTRLTKKERRERKDKAVSDISKALLLFHRCLSIFCDNSKDICKSVKKQIKNSKCLKYIPQGVENIMKFHCKNVGK